MLLDRMEAQLGNGRHEFHTGDHPHTTSEKDGPVTMRIMGKPTEPQRAPQERIYSLNMIGLSDSLNFGVDRQRFSVGFRDISSKVKTTTSNYAR